MSHIIPVNPVIVLRTYVSAHASQQAAAQALGISPQYITDLLRGRRGFSAAMLSKLGLARIVVKESELQA